jgi:DNA-binding MarR family transcriptional regulator
MEKPVEKAAEIAVNAKPDGCSAIEEATDLLQGMIIAHNPLDDPAWDELLDLPLSQVKGMRAIKLGGARTIGGVASYLRISQPTASLLVERLVSTGLVERSEDPNDRRRMLVRLSPRGEGLIERLSGNFREQFMSELMRLSDDELIALVRGLRALTAAMPDEAARRVRLF